MIRSVLIERLRGIRRGKLDDLSNLVILVGPNASGKSTILDALLIGANPSPPSGVGLAVQRHIGQERGTKWLSWKAGSEGHVRISVKTREGSTLECKVLQTKQQHTINCQYFIREKSKTHQTTATVLFTPDNHFKTQGIVKLRDGLPEIRLIETWAGATHDPLHQIYSEAAEQGRKKQAIQLISDIVPEMDGIEVLTDNNKPYVAVTYKDRAIPVSLAGDGIQSMIRLCFGLAASPGGIVLIEEPEVHQHPGAMRQSARAIMATIRRGVQVVLSTHSLEFIDALLAECEECDLDEISLYRLRLDGGNLLSSCLSGEEVSSSRSEIENDLR